MFVVTMVNVGGVWDNVKKYVEVGYGGGKGSFVHEVIVVGDMVGDLFKDIFGFFLNIFLKLMSIVVLVFVDQFSLVGLF